MGVGLHSDLVDAMQAPAGEGDFDERPLGHCFAVGLPPKVWVRVDDVAAPELARGRRVDRGAMGGGASQGEEGEAAI